MNNSERSLCAAVVLGLAMLLIVTPAAADGPNEDWMTVGGSLRMRGEWKRDFKFGDETPIYPGDNDEDYGLSQLRLWSDLRFTDRLSAHLELQDAHIFDQESVNDTNAPNIYADELDLHQGYVDFRPGADAPLSVRLGRQKLLFGAQRLVSPLEWVNTARVWDGVRVSYGEKNDRSLDGFATVITAVDPLGFNDREDTGKPLWDSQFHGVYYSDWNLVPGGQIDAYGLLRLYDGPGDADDTIFTVGGRGLKSWGNFSANAEAALQTGSWQDIDHRAWMFHVEVAQTLSESAGTLGAAFNMGSGDDDESDDEHKTFDNLYPLNHAYYGYMDYFALQNLRNLELSYKLKTPQGALVRFAYQGFWLVEPESDRWYLASGVPQARVTGINVGESAVGSEFDATIAYDLTGQRISLLAGYSYFLPGDYLQAPLDEPASFFYVQSKLSFGQ